MSSEPLVICRGLSKTYITPSGGIEALRSVDAEFAIGEVTAVVGASGSGKSTLLRALAGLDRPTSGELLIDGRNLTTSSAASLRRHRHDLVTYVNQKPADNFIPHLTLAQHAHDGPPRARDLLAEVGLAHRLDSTPTELSGGEQARGAFALALARATPLIVIDEPTAELDHDSAAPLLEAIRRHAGAGVAFVIATHDPDVTAIADKVVRIDRGQVVGDDYVPTPARHPVAIALGEPVVEVAGVSKSYRRGNETIQAIRDVTLELRRGEIGVLLGRSGSGKSTLLTLLAGWQEPDSGRILRDRIAFGDASLGWVELGYLPQRFGLMPELSVRENIGLPARLSGRQAELTLRVEELLNRFGLDELADRRPQETSIGQQQRTALARALLLRPTCLFADEPTSHQDAGWRDAVWRQLVLAATEGTTCLIATHEEQASALATRLWRITEGTISHTAD